MPERLLPHRRCRRDRPNGQLRIIDRAKDVGKLNGGAMFAPNYIENKLKFFPQIKEGRVLWHDRDQVCAFINIDFEAVGNWAERQGLPYGGYVDLASKPRCCSSSPTASARSMPTWRPSPAWPTRQVARFLVLHKELDPDDDELTRTARCAATSSPRSTACWSMRCTAAHRAVHRNPGQVRGRAHRQRQRHAARSSTPRPMRLPRSVPEIPESTP
jgi:hypothetical protein